jgi:5'-nucleotidase
MQRPARGVLNPRLARRTHNTSEGYMKRSQHTAEGPPVRRGPIPKAVIGLAAAAMVAPFVATVAPQVNAAPGDEKVQILSFNDYHGHVEDDTAGTIDGTFGGEAAGGGEYLSTKLTELRNASTANDSFTVAAGDLIGGSPYFSGLFHDEPSVESLNEMGLDFSGVGNHEFDEGVDELVRMQDGGCHPVDGCYFPDMPYAGADFQWLAANVTEDAPDGIDDFEDSIPDYSIETTEGGNKIAFIGMTLEDTPELVAASGITGFTFEDEIAAGAAAVTAIQTEDPEVETIILMLHEGGIPVPFDINSDCSASISGPILAIAAGLDPEIDAIVSGHTHQPYICSLPDPDTNPRPVVSAFSFGRVVTEINIEINNTTGEMDRTTFTMENHEVLQSALTKDPAVTAVIDKWTPLAEDQGLAPVGRITETITRGGDPTGSDRGVESAAGNLVADAQLASTALLSTPADVAFMNPGGLRSDLVFEAYGMPPIESVAPVRLLDTRVGDEFKTIDNEFEGEGPIVAGGEIELTVAGRGGVDDDAIAAVMNVGVIRPEARGFLTIYPCGEDRPLASNTNFSAGGVVSNPVFAQIGEDGKVCIYSSTGAELYADLNASVPDGGSPMPLLPARLLDTRDGDDFTTTDNLFEGEGPIQAGTEVELQVTGRGEVPDDASAVALNVGAVRPDERGFLTIYPCGEDRPLTSSVNYAPGTTVSNAANALIGEDGKVCIYSSKTVNVIADVNATIPDNEAPTPLAPARLLETRSGDVDKTIDGLFEGDGRIGPNAEVELQVTGRGGVPETATAVTINVGAVRASQAGYVTVYPCGEDRPLASSINYRGDDVISNSVVAQIGEDGKVCIYTLRETDLIADVTGFVEDDGVVSFGEAFAFQPFNNTMFVLPMTGQQIIDVLEEQCQPAGSSRPFLHLGVSEGFTYDLETTIVAGDCTAITVSNVELDGVALVPGDTYNVAVNNFLADGGDNFDTFADVDPNDRVPGAQDIDALIDYFEANDPVSAPGTDRVNEI